MSERTRVEWQSNVDINPSGQRSYQSQQTLNNKKQSTNTRHDQKKEEGRDRTY